MPWLYFAVPGLLLGLLATAIPPLIHLLSRRRYQVVDWGAMQFLQISETTRRRLLLEEILLLLLRVAAILLMVLGMASPIVQVPGLARVAGRGNRDVVLIFDGSASMGETGTGKPAADAAKEWAGAFLDTLAAGDGVSVLQAKQEVVPVVGELTHDLQQVRGKIARMPAPRGGCDWPQAVQAAHKVLVKSQRPDREIIVLSDNQRYSWADDNALLRWELLATELHDQAIRPRIWVVNVAPGRPANPPNWTLAPLRASRAVASVGQLVTFRTALELRGQQEYRPPHRLRLEVDGSPVTDLAAPRSADLGEKGQVPLSFSHRFTVAGSHLVSAIVEPDPPVEQRGPDYRIKDHLPGDNRQDFAVEVLPALPVLLVDGDDRLRPKHRGTDFLRDALAPARDRTPVVLARVVPIQEFEPGLLAADLGKDPGTRPRVLVLSNVARLTAAQQEAVAQFLSAGGGVLVTLGDRVDAAHYNEQLFRGGQGWLPARLEEPAGDEDDLAHAPAPLPSSFFHPALDLFREVKAGGLGEARFPRWWKVTVPGRTSPAVPVALLTNNDPLLVERPYPGAPARPTPGAGRVLLTSVPLDNSWHTNLPDLPAFAPLAHELIYYLAGARSAEYNLQPGQPLQYRPDREDSLAGLSLQPPEGEAKPLVQDANPDADVYPVRVLRQAQGPLVVYEGTRETGVYQLKTPDRHTIYYVVQPDPRESDLTPCDEKDRERVARLVPSLKYENDRQQLTAALVQTSQWQPLWDAFLVAVIVFLCAEVLLTRRIARNR